MGLPKQQAQHLNGQVQLAARANALVVEVTLRKRSETLRTQAGGGAGATTVIGLWRRQQQPHGC
jgi:hypothetical protein